jgi:hypothetical protein
MYSIRRFGVVRTATIVAVMYVIVVAIVFVPFAGIAAIGGTAISGDVATGGAGFVGILLFGLIAAVAYGAFGWVFTALACLLYNVVAGWVGGVEVQLEAVAPPVPPPAWTPQGSAPPAPPTAG